MSQVEGSKCKVPELALSIHRSRSGKKASAPGGPWEGREAGEEVREGIEYKIKQDRCGWRNGGPLESLEHHDRQGFMTNSKSRHLLRPQQLATAGGQSKPISSALGPPLSLPVQPTQGPTLAFLLPQSQSPHRLHLLAPTPVQTSRPLLLAPTPPAPPPPVFWHNPSGQVSLFAAGAIVGFPANAVSSSLLLLSVPPSLNQSSPNSSTALEG